MIVALYTYDEEADALYILLVPDAQASIARTEELSDRLHVDLDDDATPVGIEILYPGLGFDLSAVRERFGIDVQIPFTFAA